VTLAQLLLHTQTLLQAATPGPWYIEGAEVRGDYDSYATDNGIADCTVRVCECYRISETLDGSEADRELIASAPTTLAKLIEICKVQADALEKIRSGTTTDINKVEFYTKKIAYEAQMDVNEIAGAE
jgi:hypothetical protein